MDTTSPFTLWSLASGSSGNAFLIQGGDSLVLLDAGYGAHVLAGFIRQVGVDPARVNGILITHEHSDHSSGAVAFSRRFRAPIYANAATLSAVMAGSAEADARPIPTGHDLALGDLEIRSFAIHHDAAEPVGYSIQCGGRRICYLTDTGHLCDRLTFEMAGASLVVLESNHDVQRLLTGPYPDFLKHRILGDQGHLSNEAAGRATATLSEGDRPVCVWLAHLSARNNTPTLARRAVRMGLLDGNVRNLRLSVAGRDRPSLCWRASENWWQPGLF